MEAVLKQYYGQIIFGDKQQSISAPLDTITSKARFGLVTIKGVDYKIVDIGFAKYDQTISNFSDFDALSIMLYAIPEELTIGDFKTEWNTCLSKGNSC